MFKKIILLPFKMLKKLVDIVIYPFKAILKRLKKKKSKYYESELIALEKAVLMAKQHKLDIFIECELTDYSKITMKTKESIKKIKKWWLESLIF